MGAGPALAARSLHRFFHDGDLEIQALAGVSLELHGGELVAVTGPSGSGKSTLLACLAGLDVPDGGSVTVCGHRLPSDSERERTRLRARYIGVLGQSGNLVEHLTVGQNVTLARGLAARPAGRDPGELLTTLGVAHRTGARPSRLSGGEAARAALAVAAVDEPPVLLADEPTAELDSHSEDQVLALLRGLADGGAAVLVAGHSRAVTDVADRTIPLVDGRVATESAA